jgi:DNA-binding response OmpR family regulator
MPLDKALRDRQILIVEDDPVIALDLQHIIQDAGATVIGPARRLSEAVALAERSRLDAAVLD